MGYLDFSHAELLALTRQRRLERERRQAKPPPMRFTVSGAIVEYEAAIECTQATSRSASRVRAWRIRQWREGNRACAYCRCALENIPRKVRQGVPVSLRCVTVDHREPIGLGGDDAAWNYAMACWACNNRKGLMTEAEFRALLSVSGPPIPPAPPMR